MILRHALAGTIVAFATAVAFLWVAWTLTQTAIIHDPGVLTLTKCSLACTMTITVIWTYHLRAVAARVAQRTPA